MNPLQSAALAEVKTLSFDFPESHKLAKSEALDAAIAVTKVDDGFDNSLCVDAQTKVKSRLKYIESWRVAAQRPLTDLKQLVQDVAANESQALNDQWLRLERLASVYTKKQKQLREEEERKRQEELDKIERERVAKEKEAQKKIDDERKAKEAEVIAKADAQIAAATTDEELKAAESSASCAMSAIATEAAAKTEVATAEIAQASVAATRQVILSTKPATKPQGQSVRSRWDFEVVDAGELYRARPDLCHIVEKRAEILKELAAGKREIAGLRIFEDVKAGVRT